MINNQISVLELMLHDQLVGYASGFQNGRNVLTFSPEFIQNHERYTFSLTTQPHFPNVDLSTPLKNNQRLHPILSNLLPEGALRELLSTALKIHIDHEFQLLNYLGKDLPGALIANAVSPEEIPDYVLKDYKNSKPITLAQQDSNYKFSLAGVRMKFSGTEKDGRYLIHSSGKLGNWIIKTPSALHNHVPLNEYTAMNLAQLAGVDIPEIKLIDMQDIDNLPNIKLPDEKYAFAIKRFDREKNNRVHMEDFAQVFLKYPHDKYTSANYERIAKTLYKFTGHGLLNAQQYARRLLINILLANGDAHLKNWSLLYTDKFTPQLSPAYDILTTPVYIEGEKEYALNMAGIKKWYDVTMEHFKAWAKNSDVPWQAIKPHLLDTTDKARSLWPQALKELPMNESHKNKLKEHWRNLQNDFSIKY